VSNYDLTIYIKKYLKAKEKLWKFQHFTMQKYNLQKESSKRNQTPSKYYNFIINPKFQHKPKYYISKSPIKIDLLPEGQNPLSYYNI
jgi:hypothetical protein